MNAIVEPRRLSWRSGSPPSEAYSDAVEGLMMELVMVSDSTRRGLGITAGLDSRLVRKLAVRCEQLGYDSLWSNDEPAARGLDTLAQFAAVTDRVDLGVGVLPLHRYAAGEIAAEVDCLEIDPARLWVGVGSGTLPRQIDALERAVAELRTLLPAQTRIMVAAMRPRLCRLGGAVADGVLLNWMLPQQIARAREWVAEGAAERGRPTPVIASYVRVAVGPGAERRLRQEEGVYRTINEGHRRHFAAMHVPLGSVGIAAAKPSAIPEALADYHAVLELPIVRVLADAHMPALAAVADAAAP